MERTQEGDLTEVEICKFWTALSGQAVETSSEISEVGIQEMVGKTEADLRVFLIENGPAIFGRLPDEEGDLAEESLMTALDETATRVQAAAEDGPSEDGQVGETYACTYCGDNYQGTYEDVEYHERTCVANPSKVEPTAQGGVSPEDTALLVDEQMVSAALKIQVTPGVRDRC